MLLLGSATSFELFEVAQKGKSSEWESSPACIFYSCTNLIRTTTETIITCLEYFSTDTKSATLHASYPRTEPTQWHQNRNSRLQLPPALPPNPPPPKPPKHNTALHPQAQYAPRKMPNRYSKACGTTTSTRHHSESSCWTLSWRS